MIPIVGTHQTNDNEIHARMPDEYHCNVFIVKGTWQKYIHLLKLFIK